MDARWTICLGRSILACTFLLLVFGMGVRLLPVERKAIKSKRIQTIPATLHEKLPSDFPYKYLFIDLNGGVCRAIGRRMCNSRLLYDGGHLGFMYECDGSSPAPFIESTASFASRIRELGIPFLYVQIPAKFALEEGQMPTGWPHYNPNAEALQVEAELAERGVRTLDLVRAFVATKEDVERNFYKTDHHWQGRAAFAAARLVACEIANVLDEPALRDPPELDIANWTRHMRKGAFLGSHGRRTGRFFAGTDDFEYFVPNFETKIRRSMSGKSRANGSYKKAVLEMHFLSRPLHDRNAYGVYGTDRNDVAYVNTKAKSRVKVLVVKDSFANPVVGFLSTVCREIVKVDPRRCTSKEEIFQMVAKHRPDIVVMLVNPTALRNEKFMLTPAARTPVPKGTMSR